MLLVKLAASAVLLALVAGQVEMDRIAARMAEVRPGWLILGCVLTIVQIVLGALRWRSIIAATGHGVPVGETIRIYYVGVFFNMCLPGAVVGDGVRIWHAGRAGLGIGAAASSVILDRVVAMLCLMVVAALTQFRLLDAFARTAPWLAYLFPLLAIAACAGLALLAAVSHLPVPWGHWPVWRALTRLSADTRRLLSTPAGAASLGWALLAQTVLVLAVAALAVGLSVPIGLVDCMILVPPVMLMNYLPISIGGWGVREGAMVTAFALVGVPTESALALSILVGLVGMAVSLPGGVLWLAAPAELRERMLVKA